MSNRGKRKCPQCGTWTWWTEAKADGTCEECVRKEVIQMKLTEEQAIDITIELWKWLAGTGDGRKESWEGWDKYGRMRNDCPLCEYATQAASPEKSICSACPYRLAYKPCMTYSTPFWNWAQFPGNIETRKEYAKDFLLQLYELKAGTVVPKQATEVLLTQQAIDIIESLIYFDDNADPHLSETCTLENILDALISAQTALSEEAAKG